MNTCTDRCCLRACATMVKFGCWGEEPKGFAPVAHVRRVSDTGQVNKMENPHIDLGVTVHEQRSRTAFTNSVHEAFFKFVRLDVPP